MDVRTASSRYWKGCYFITSFKSQRKHGGVTCGYSGRSNSRQFH